MLYDKHPIPNGSVRPCCRHDRLDIKVNHIECRDCGTEWRPVAERVDEEGLVKAEIWYFGGSLSR